MKRNAMVYLTLSLILYVMAATACHRMEMQLADLRAELRRLEARK